MWGWLWFFVPTGGKVLMGVTATMMMLAIMLAAMGGTDIRLSEGGILSHTFTPWSDVLAFKAERESIHITSVSNLLNAVDDVWELPTGDRTAEALGILRERASRARETE